MFTNDRLDLLLFFSNFTKHMYLFKKQKNRCLLRVSTPEQHYYKSFNIKVTNFHLSFYICFLLSEKLIGLHYTITAAILKLSIFVCFQTNRNFLVIVIVNNKNVCIQYIHNIIVVLILNFKIFDTSSDPYFLIPSEKIVLRFG